MNDFYNTPLVPTRNTLARAEQVQQELAAIAAGFDKLPTEAQQKLLTVAYAETTGTGTAYLATPPYPQSGFATGQGLHLKIHTSNTGAATLNVMGLNGVYLGVKPIVRADGTELEAGDLPIGAVMEFRYDGINWRMVSTVLRGEWTGTLPSQTGNAGKALFTDGATPYWKQIVPGDMSMATTRLLGRTTAGTGGAEEISVAAPLSLAGGILTTSIATARLVGRATAGTGAMEALTVTAPLAVSGGAVSISMATSRLLGRTTANTGTAEEISVGQRMTLSSGVLNAAGDVPTSRSSNTQLAAADDRKVLLLTSTFTQTLVSAATLDAGWSVRLMNVGTGQITIDPNGSETIGGVATAVMNPGDVWDVMSDGTNLQLARVAGDNVALLTSGTSWTVPAGVYVIEYDVVGGGGGSYRNSGSRTGGASGGRSAGTMAVTPGSSIAYSIGAAGTGDNTTPTAGGNTTFGSITATGGGAGASGQASAAPGTGSGGTINATGYYGIRVYNAGGSDSNGFGGTSPGGPLAGAYGAGESTGSWGPAIPAQQGAILIRYR